MSAIFDKIFVEFVDNLRRKEPIHITEHFHVFFSVLR